MDLVDLSIVKYTNAIMERVRCLTLEGVKFKKEVPTRMEVANIVASFIDDEKKFTEECWCDSSPIDVKYTSSQALFLAQPSGFSVDVVDDYLTGRLDDESENDDTPWTLEDVVRTVISMSLDIARCNCHNSWDKGDNPDDVQFVLEKSGIRKS